jgi:hypothetical protein
MINTKVYDGLNVTRNLRIGEVYSCTVALLFMLRGSSAAYRRMVASIMTMVREAAVKVRMIINTTSFPVCLVMQTGLNSAWFRDEARSTPITSKGAGAREQLAWTTRPKRG